MTEYINFEGLIIPVIKIGRGSSNFFSNLVRCYIKNYNIVQVNAKSERINLLIWVIYQLRQEYAIRNIQTFYDYNGEMNVGFNVIKNGIVTPVELFEEIQDVCYIKIGKNSDIESICRVINKNTCCTLIAAGNSCHNLFKILVYACTYKYVWNEIRIIKTFDKNGNDKAGVSVYIYRSDVVPYEDNSELYSVQ